MTDLTTSSPYYIIYCDDVQLKQADWTPGTLIVVSADGLNVGTHKVSVTFYDGLGYSVTDEVIVEVTSRASPPLDPLIVAGIIIGGAGGVAVIVVFRVRSRKRSTKNFYPAL